jgi:hypothetical protein
MIQGRKECGSLIGDRNKEERQKSGDETWLRCRNDKVAMNQV